MSTKETFGPGMDETGKINPALPARGVSYGKPPPGARNWSCDIDGHSDPDNSGLCIHCQVVLWPEGQS